MRKRFRGNQPISTSLELEGGGDVGLMGEERRVKQLYGGKEAFGVPVREESRGDGAMGFDPENTRGL